MTGQTDQHGGPEFTPRKNRTYIGDGLYEVHQVLIPFVQQCMSASHGQNWRTHALEVLNRNRREAVGDDFEQDLSNLLNLMRQHFAPFSKVLQSRGRTLLSKLLNVRNQWAHESEIDLSDTFQAFDTFSKLFVLLNHPAPEITATRNTLQLLLAQGVPRPPGHDAADPIEGHAMVDERRDYDGRQEPSTSDGSTSSGASVAAHPRETGANRQQSAVGRPIVSTRAVVIGAVGAAVVAIILTKGLPISLRSSLAQNTDRNASSTIQTSAVDGQQTSVQGHVLIEAPSRPQSSASDPRRAPAAISTGTGEGSSPRPSRSAAAETSEPPNLVLNGDFSEDWDIGWRKEIRDPTGSLLVERESGMLHIALSGQTTAQVWQDVPIAGDRGIEGLMFEASVKLVPKRTGMLGIAPPVETALIVQFRDRDKHDVGQIWYTQFATIGLEGSGLVGVPDTLHATGQRCQVPLQEGFNRIAESLDRKAKDCLATPISDIGSLMVTVLMRTNNPESSAEAFLDNVRLFYR